MADSWHIPRASLSSSSSHSSRHSNSRRSSVDNDKIARSTTSSSRNPGSKTRINELRERFDEKRVPKRGSRSSQGSSDSTHSSHSAGSGSLLLTAANLESFARIHHAHNPAFSIQEEEVERPGSYGANIQLAQDQITLDMPPMMGGKAKDLDAVSMASSTHFTVVNGIGRQPKVPKSGLCDRGHQITVLIVTMSVFFMIGISAAVYFMEMRAREMPY